jgi:hypothetical protein
MRTALKEIASFYNPSLENDGGQAAALAAREILQRLGLFTENAPSADASRHRRT